LVIGKITSLGSLIIIGAIAILFLKQARESSLGIAGRDVGLGLTGISSGISNLFGSFINPITGIFDTISNIFSFGNQGEQSNPAENTYGYIRPEPTPATSSQGSATATQATINTTVKSNSYAGQVGGYTSGAITAHRATGGFGRAN